MRNTSPGSRKQVDPLVAEVDAMRVPHVVTDPTRILGIVGGIEAELGFAELHVTNGFGKVRV